MDSSTLPQQGFPHYTPFDLGKTRKQSYTDNWTPSGVKSGSDSGIWASSGGTTGYDMSSSYTPSSDLYRKNQPGRYSGVEMDQLSYQMMALGATGNTNGDTSQLASPAIQSNGYFNNQSQIHTGTALNEQNPSSSKLNNYNKWTPNGQTTVNATTSPLNSVSNYSNYLNQQQQQQQTPNYSNNNIYKQQHSNNNYQQQSSNQMAQQSGGGGGGGGSSYHSNNDSKSTSNYSYMKQPSISSKDSKPQSSSTNLTSIDQNDIENFKMKIQLKDIIISKLELELEKEKEFQKILSNSSTDNNGNFEVPKNQEQLYNKLVETIQVTKKELDDTKSRLEALITAIALNPNTSNYKNGRYDEEEIAHKVISKMQILTEENDELSKMLSYGKSKEKDIEIGLLRKQNTELREKVSKLESKLNDEKP